MDRDGMLLKSTVILQMAMGGEQSYKEGKMDPKILTNLELTTNEKGFGDLNVEFWYGLNCLTQTGNWELRVDIEIKNKTSSLQCL